MSLKDLEIKKEYRSLLDNVAMEFYIPLLKKATRYDRAVGFFSSSALIEISKGISALVAKNGRIRIIASPYLSAEDIKSIKLGYELRDDVIRRSIMSSLHPPASTIEEERLNLIATLIANGTLDIKIVLMELGNNMGMYHEKMGIISDPEGNRVAFSGSMNESLTAMRINYEAIDVYLSWTEDVERVIGKERAFESIWNDKEPNIKTVSFPDLSEEIIKRYQRGDPNLSIDIEEYQRVNKKTKSISRYMPTMPNDLELYTYQNNAINTWSKNNYRGIYDMATGTGKTLTGLASVCRLAQENNNKLAVIILCPYQHLVDQWVEDIIEFNINPIIGYSSSPQKDWKKRLSNAIFDQRIRPDEKDFFCFICTNSTFLSIYVQEQLSKIKSEILIVADEAHNLGAPKIRQVLDERFKYRLALSATLERHRDQEGTDFLLSYFGEKCIEYTLDQAIEEKKLTPYNYYPVTVYLNEQELVEYTNLSIEISRCIVKGKNGKIKLNSYGEFLAIKRSRLVAAAINKIPALMEKIEPYTKDNHILVYCGATNVLSPKFDVLETDESEIRQIDLITQILGNTLGMRVSQFTSRENMEERSVITSKFKTGYSLQALVAIKCLDEGVNIPGIRTAFILASTTNPKEYIQRRGRVLRRAPGKDKAEIYDFVTLPRPMDEISSLTKQEVKRDLSLVINELRRIREFGRLALNSMDANELYQSICKRYSLDPVTLKFEGEDYGDE